MTARFAGSRFLDERRRRRLATENGDVELSVPVPVSPPQAMKSRSQTSAAGPRAVVGGLPLRKLISPRLWKHVAVSLLWLYLGCGIIWCGQKLESGQLSGITQLAGTTHWNHLLNLTSGSASRWYGALTLFLAGQLALLIGWVRSQSPRDFGGKYKVWTWAALVWFLFSGCLATQLHYAVSGLLFQVWDYPLWQREVLGWLIPGYAITLQLLWVLHRDMLDCRPSLAMLAVSCLFAFLSGLSSLGLLETGSELGAPLFAVGFQWSVLVSMMLHARFAVYQCCDPPRLNASVAVRRKWLCWPLTRSRRALQRDESSEHRGQPADLNSVSTDSVPKTESDTSDAVPADEPRADEPPVTDPVEEAPAPVAKRSKTKRKKRSAPAVSVPAETSPVAEEPRATSEVEAPADNQAPVLKKQESQEAPCDSEETPVESEVADSDDSRTLRIDTPIDPNDLKGLSKRQRRALRKQRKEEQRARNRR